MRLKQACPKEDVECNTINLTVGFQSFIIGMMKSKGITHKELAKRMRVSKSNVTYLLTWSNNLSLKSIAKMFIALDFSDIKIYLKGGNLND